MNHCFYLFLCTRRDSELASYRDPEPAALLKSITATSWLYNLQVAFLVSIQGAPLMFQAWAVASLQWPYKLGHLCLLMSGAFVQVSSLCLGCLTVWYSWHVLNYLWRLWWFHKTISNTCLCYSVFEAGSSPHCLHIWYTIKNNHELLIDPLVFFFSGIAGLGHLDASCHAGDRIQGSEPARQAFHQLTCITSPPMAMLLHYFTIIYPQRSWGREGTEYLKEFCKGMDDTLFLENQAKGDITEHQSQQLLVTVSSDDRTVWAKPDQVRVTFLWAAAVQEKTGRGSAESQQRWERCKRGEELAKEGGVITGTRVTLILQTIWVLHL